MEQASALFEDFHTLENIKHKSTPSSYIFDQYISLLYLTKSKVAWQQTLTTSNPFILLHVFEEQGFSQY